MKNKNKNLICGIYKIEDVKTENVYVGQTDDIKRRLTSHNSKIKYNYHEYEEFNEAYIDDPNRIKFEILEECDEGELEDREKYWIDYCKKVGWIVINKNPNFTARKSKVRDTSLMKLAQRGAGNGNASLTENQAIEVILHKQQGLMTHKQLADIYNISQSQISKIGIHKWAYLS